VHAIVFTAGVGQHAASVRSASLAGLEALGVELDEEANAAATGSEAAVVSAPGSRVSVLVVPTDEELEIARETLGVVAR
jgi:acetate kinase